MNQSLAIVIGVDNLIGSILRDLLLVLITQSHDTVVASLQSPGQNLIHALEGVGNAVVDGLLLDARHNIAFLGTHGNRLGRMNQSLAIVIGVDDLIGSVRRRNLLVHDLETVKIDRRAFVTFRVLHHSDLTVGNGHGPGLVGLHIALGGLGLAEGIGIAGGDAGDGDSAVIIRSAFQGLGVAEGTAFCNGQLEFRAGQRSKLIVNTLDLGEVQLAQVALGSNIGESNALGLAIIHLEGKGRSTQGIGRFLFKALGLGAHPDLIAQMIVLLIVRSTSLGSGFAEVPGDLIVIRGSAVGVAIELHEVIQISQNAFANFVIDRSHNGGTDGLMLNGVDDSLERSIQSVGAVSAESAVHLAVVLHPGVNGSILLIAVGDRLHGAILLGEAISHTINMDTSSDQSRADSLHCTSLNAGGSATVAFNAIIIATPSTIARRNLLGSISVNTLIRINIVGRLTVCEKHHKLIIDTLDGVKQIRGQLEASLGVSAAASFQTVNYTLGRITALLVGDIHHRLYCGSSFCILHHRNITGHSRGSAIGIQGIAIQESLCGLLSSRQSGFILMVHRGDPGTRMSVTCPRTPAIRPIFTAVIATAIIVLIFPSSISLVALIDPFAGNAIMLVLALGTATSAEAHGTRSIDHQDSHSLRVGGDSLVASGDFQVYVEKVLRASLSKGTRKLDRPIVLRTLRTVCLVVDGVARVRDLLRLVSLHGECRDLHQAQAHYQGHEQAQCPLADGLAPGGSLAGIVICHDSFPP